MNTSGKHPDTFESIFFDARGRKPLKVPDYQRAYAWEEKQIQPFIDDLKKYATNEAQYYFGHFIIEETTDGWEIVDGQQRITTLILFLMVSRVHSPSLRDNRASTLIEDFRTVTYDDSALKHLFENLSETLHALEPAYRNEQKASLEDKIQNYFPDPRQSTRSQKRILYALLQFHIAYKDLTLNPDDSETYIRTIMESISSHLLAKDKTVAVNIFEMQNTRGVVLSTIEILKAKLMQFVYEHGGSNREDNVKAIQKEFSEIYAMEGRLETTSFRGRTTMEQFLRLHLRAVDDCKKVNRKDFWSPEISANSEAILEYVTKRLHGATQSLPISDNLSDAGIDYALNLASELNKSRTYPKT